MNWINKCRISWAARSPWSNHENGQTKGTILLGKAYAASTISTRAHIKKKTLHTELLVRTANGERIMEDTQKVFHFLLDLEDNIMVRSEFIPAPSIIWTTSPVSPTTLDRHSLSNICHRSLNEAIVGCMCSVFGSLSYLIDQWPTWLELRSDILCSLHK